MTTNSSTPFSNWRNWQIALATIFVVGVAIGFWLLIRFWLVFFILFIAIVISTAITPAVDWLYRRRLSRAAGVILIYLLLLALVIGFIFLVAPLVINQAAEFSQALPEYYQSFREWLVRSQSLLVRRMGLQLPQELQFLPAPPVQAVPTPELPATPNGGDEERMLTQVSLVVEYANLIASGIFVALALFLLAFYWTLDGERNIRALLLLAPQRRRDEIREIIIDIQERVGGYVRGLVLLSLIVGGMAMAAYFVLDLPYALSLGIIAGIMEVVPIVGPALGALPAILVAFSLGNPTTILAILGAPLVIQLLENTLFGPRIMDKSVGVNPILTLLALATFTSLLGIPGALLAVPIAAVFQLLLEKFLIQASVSEEEMPEGRDTLSALRLEAKELSSDVRKQIREKDGNEPQESDQMEDTIEEIAEELDRILSQLKQQQVGPGGGQL